LQIDNDKKSYESENQNNKKIKLSGPSSAPLENDLIKIESESKSNNLKEIQLTQEKKLEKKILQKPTQLKKKR